MDLVFELCVDEEFSQSINNCSELIKTINKLIYRNDTEQMDLKSFYIGLYSCLKSLYCNEYFKLMFETNMPVKQLVFKALKVLLCSGVEFKFQVQKDTIALMNNIIGLDCGSLHKLKHNKLIYCDFFKQILPEINELTHYMREIIDDKAHTSSFVNIIIYIIRTISLSDLLEFNFFENIFSKVITSLRDSVAIPKILSAMSSNYLDNEQAIDITSENFNEKSDELLKLYEKYSDQLINVLREDQINAINKNRIDIITALLNITCYVDKQFRRIRRADPKNKNMNDDDKENYTKLNSFIIIFLENEMKNVSDPSGKLISYFYDLLIEHVDDFDALECEEDKNSENSLYALVEKLMNRLIEIINKCHTKTNCCDCWNEECIENKTYYVIDKVLKTELFQEKFHLENFEQFNDTWFKSLKNFETNAYLIIKQLLENRKSLILDISSKGITDTYSKEIVDTLIHAFSHKENENKTVHQYQHHAILYLIFSYAQTRSRIKFKNDGVDELMNKYTNFLLKNFNEEHFTLFLDYYTKLFENCHLANIIRHESFWDPHIKQIMFALNTAFEVQVDFRMSMPTLVAAWNFIKLLTDKFGENTKDYEEIFDSILSRIRNSWNKPNELNFFDSEDMQIDYMDDSD